MATIIKRGDAVCLPVELLVDGDLPKLSDIECVEFFVGNVRKVYPGDVSYLKIYDVFSVPLTQADTFQFKAKRNIKLEARVKFMNKVVKGADRPVNIFVIDSSSREVL